ncbi:MAG: dienelactone hydrolase family protein [Acidobacteriota bacterium]
MAATRPLSLFSRPESAKLGLGPLRNSWSRVLQSLGALCLGFLMIGAAACGSAEPEATDELAEKMAEEHADDTTEASPVASQEPAVEVVGEEIVYGTLDGTELTGYLARPADAGDAPHPGIVVIQEWWGLNDNIRAAARRLAGEGYQALAVDLYGGEVAAEPEQARALMSASRENPQWLQDNLRAGHDFLRQQGAPKVGSVGWCFGGGLSLRLALELEGELDAAVMYYGSVVTEKESLATLETPLLGLFGDQDQGIPVEGVQAMDAALQELGKEATVIVYADADHAFANPTGNRYQEAAATAAWEQSQAFFARHLKGEAQAESGTESESGADSAESAD